VNQSPDLKFVQARLAYTLTKIKEEIKMKTSYTSVAAFVLMTVVAGSAFAEGSRITNSTINNSSNNQNATTRAKGGFLGGAEASTGSVIVKGGSRVTNSTIRNSSNNRNATTTAEGGFLGGAKADTGSVKVSD
jgi:hypothetical protein